jgi:nitrite reductase/ring-hydroxylating ferredoxin subunit/DMSO/TMAO reductase YedYZ heme-binding membrane subunit
VSGAYKAVGWNRQKKTYDRVALGGVILYLLTFAGVSLAMRPGITAETLVLRAFGTAAFLLLHVVLSIGPLARLDPGFLPLVYNRRHLGVLTFCLGLVHGSLALFQFHAAGDVSPLVSLLTANPRFDSLAQFPFQLLGLTALGILFLMAATSHDFWLKQLTAPTWKALHMAVYAAYALLAAHVALGALQSERRPELAAMLAVGVTWLLALHLVAAWRERRGDRATTGERHQGYVAVCAVDEIPDGRARIVCLAGERVAVFRHGDRISALSNVCQHQNGPLGEGRIVGQCVVCPWHGYEYDPESGRSPAPFTERVPTFNVRLADGRVWLDPRPNAAGTRVEPAIVERPAPAPPADEFYVGYRPAAPPALARRLRRVIGGLLPAGALVAAALASLQAPFAEATFEYGTVRTFAGRLSATPYPVLEAASDPAAPSHLLVDRGKHGAAARVAGLAGRNVSLDGQLIERDGLAMIEMSAAAPADRGTAAPAASDRSLGEQRLRGEIVDSKCHLGVMKPGEGKVHRACAARCISGGVPPVLWVRDVAGRSRYYLLLSRDGGPLGRQVLDRVAEPVEVPGEVLRRGDLWLLRTDPTQIRRITEDAG